MSNNLNAKFLNINTIQLCVNHSLHDFINHIEILCNDEKIETSELQKKESKDNFDIFIVHVQSFLFGGSYKIKIQDEIEFIDVTMIMSEKIIDEKFFYDGDDLGFTYSKKETIFKLWSPLATTATVQIINKRNVLKEYVMTREDCGVFKAVVKGNLDGYRYLFSTTINGIKRVSTDPYAKASTANSEYSAVIDFAKTYQFKAKTLEPLKQYTDAIIYEASVRDLTSYPQTNVVNKGKYLGVVEENRTSSDGALVGLEHLIKLGITHLQLLPVEDFWTIDELDPSKKYNWGYDPAQYNVLEGSYSSNPNDPYCRVNEFKQLVDKLHANKIKVNMDVVYNHMYEVELSAFEKLTPNYYFRRDKNGVLSNGSFCGNELASERKMCSKFIVDSCKFWIKEYNVDGFRFDLMGLIDIDTMNAIVEECLKIKEGLMFYGEGWDMPSILPSSNRATIFNYEKTPKIAHFNDVYRDIVKGRSMDDMTEKGFLTGDETFLEGFKYALLGTCTNYCFSQKFSNANFSINYVECHDNETIFDKIDVTNKFDSPRQKLKRVSLITQVVLLSHGVPFIHMGQEIGLSKFGEHNTYNLGDRFNQFDYSKMEDRKWMVKSINDCIKIRKQFDFLRISDAELIKNSIEFENIDNCGLVIKYINKDLIKPYSEFKIIINPSYKTTYYDLGDYYQVLYNEAGIMKDELYSQSLMINPLTLVIVVKK